MTVGGCGLFGVFRVGSFPCLSLNSFRDLPVLLARNDEDADERSILDSSEFVVILSLSKLGVTPPRFLSSRYGTNVRLATAERVFDLLSSNIDLSALELVLP